MARVSAYVYISRHNVFYFRIRVPVDIQHLTEKKDIRRSLKTSSRRDACLAAAKWLERCDWAFDEARRTGHFSLPNLAERAEVVQSECLERHKFTNSSPVLTVVTKELCGILEQEGVTGSVIDGKLAIVRLMVDIVGDLPVDSYNRVMCRKFKDKALQLPPRTRGNSHLSVEKAIASANGKTISITTYNNYIKDLSSIFNFAIKEGYCQMNPFSGMKLKSSHKVSEARQRYSDVDIQMLFSSPLHRLGGVGEKPFRYWLPLLAVYTGARLNELCQLYLDDIVISDGIQCLMIQDSRSDQRLKNRESQRLIPLHPKLEQLGLLDYVSKLKAEGKVRLFPELSYHEKRGYSTAPSKWFALFKKSRLGNNLGQTKDFHSFRHTVADCLKQKGLPEALAAAILGHKIGGITYHRYGKDYPPEALLEAVLAIEWSLGDVAAFGKN